MEEQNYPSLYQSANGASVNTQKWYLNAIRFYLILLIFSAIVSKFAPKDVFWSILSAVTLLFTLGLSIYQAVKRFDKIWYNGRAVAESVKTRTWRFIMRAEPYEEGVSDNEVLKRFTADLNEILHDNKELGSYLQDNGEANCITEEMANIRLKSRDERKEYYKVHRVDEQRKWYAKKAKWNNRQSILWFSLMVISNCAALILVLCQIAFPKNDNFPIDTFIVMASSILTWMQVKRFQDISTSYNLTAHEITILRQGIDLVNSDKEFSDFVKDAENAFSREHTQWAARKDK